MRNSLLNLALRVVVTALDDSEELRGEFDPVLPCEYIQRLISHKALIRIGAV